MKMDFVPSTIQTKINNSFPVAVHPAICEAMHPFTKGKQVDPNAYDPQHSNYVNNHSSHSPWGYPHSWNKVPKVDIHKFDGSNLVGWVCKMKQYSPLHNIWDDETKLHVGDLYLNQE